jgi:hypothetical protein
MKKGMRLRESYRSDERYARDEKEEIAVDRAAVFEREENKGGNQLYEKDGFAQRRRIAR